MFMKDNDFDLSPIPDERRHRGATAIPRLIQDWVLDQKKGISETVDKI